MNMKRLARFIISVLFLLSSESGLVFGQDGGSPGEDCKDIIAKLWSERNFSVLPKELHAEFEFARTGSGFGKSRVVNTCHKLRLTLQSDESNIAYFCECETESNEVVAMSLCPLGYLNFDEVNMTGYFFTLKSKWITENNVLGFTSPESGEGLTLWTCFDGVTDEIQLHEVPPLAVNASGNCDAQGLCIRNGELVATKETPIEGKEESDTVNGTAESAVSHKIDIEAEDEPVNVPNEVVEIEDPFTFQQTVKAANIEEEVTTTTVATTATSGTSEEKVAAETAQTTTTEAAPITTTTESAATTTTEPATATATIGTMGTSGTFGNEAAKTSEEPTETVAGEQKETSATDGVTKMVTGTSETSETTGNETVKTPEEPTETVASEQKETSAPGVTKMATEVEMSNVEQTEMKQNTEKKTESNTRNEENETVEMKKPSKTEVMENGNMETKLQDETKDTKPVLGSATLGNTTAGPTTSVTSSQSGTEGMEKVHIVVNGNGTMETKPDVIGTVNKHDETEIVPKDINEAAVKVNYVTNYQATNVNAQKQQSDNSGTDGKSTEGTGEKESMEEQKGENSENGGSFLTPPSIAFAVCSFLYLSV